MSDYSATAQVAAPASSLFDYLAEISNLPKYFASMTSAKPGDGEAVHTTAKLPDGQEVEGEAWFHVDHSARSLSWGSEGPSNYSGTLKVSEDGDSSAVSVTISTDRAEGDHVQRGVDKTVETIKQLVEQG